MDDDTLRLPSRQLDPLVVASWLYYHLGLTQAEVADHLGLSRTSVANLLAEARERGVVTISLDPVHLRTLGAAESLQRTFGLADAYVIPSVSGADGGLTRALGRAGALYLEHALVPGDVLAVGWGHTILELAGALTNKGMEDLTVAQLVGVFSTSDQFNPGSITARIAERLRARLFHLYVPAFVATPKVRDLLLDDPTIHSALEILKSATKAIVGIGKVSPDATVVRAGLMSPIQMDELRAKAAVGDVATKYYDIHGAPVETALDRRFTGLSVEDFARIPTVIAVAGGPDKIQSVLGALRSGRISVLITDESTARSVLECESGASD